MLKTRQADQSKMSLYQKYIKNLLQKVSNKQNNLYILNIVIQIKGMFFPNSSLVASDNVIKGQKGFS